MHYQLAPLIPHQVTKVSLLICFTYHCYFLEVKKGTMNGLSGSVDHTDSVSNGNHSSKHEPSPGRVGDEPRGKYLSPKSAADLGLCFLFANPKT